MYIVFISILSLRKIYRFSTTDESPKVKYASLPQPAEIVNTRLDQESSYSFVLANLIAEFQEVA